MLILSMLFAREVGKINVDTNPSIMHNGKEYSITQFGNQTNPSSREEIILWEEDFESNAEGWSTGSGWQLSTSQYNSETYSMNSPNDASTSNGTFNLLSPTLSIAELGDGETMNFGFHLYCDTPDVDGDGDDYLDDYYAISIMDIDALAWHASSTDAIDGNSYWCGDEEVGGYLDSWVQFLDTPSFTVPSGGTLTADMMWTIESDAGASVAGSCTDGWDAANVRISTDGGETWALLHASGMGNGYDFDCGYGWIWNDAEYDTGGSLNHLAAGWGNDKDWHNASFDLSAYVGQDAIVRFAFGSDPAYCTLDDSGITGFHVDNILVSGTLDCSPENNCDTSVSGAVWVDQFYDYGDADRPGYQAWEEYVPGMAFNGNVFMDISDFAGKDIIFKVQSRYDDNDDGGSGSGLYLDDIKIYKISGGNYPAPMGLMAEPGDSEAHLSWYDMNASGTDDFVYHNGNFSANNSIYLNGTAPAWAGERFDVFGSSTVNSVTVNSINEVPVDVTIGGFAQLGTLFNTDPLYSMDVTLQPGDNTFDVSWDMNNSFVIAYTFYSVDTNGDDEIDPNVDEIVSAGLDTSPMGQNSVIAFSGGGWSNWHDEAVAFGLPDGEWGVSANLTYAGAGVTYNLLRDGVVTASGITSNMHTDTGLSNNTTYEYALTATYSDGEESAESNTVTVTPFANTVHEEGYDDGSFEAEFNAGSGNFSAVRYSAGSDGEDIVRFKWFQNGDGGAFYIKIFEDDGGMPGAETYSAVQASGNLDGWNDKDLTAAGLVVSGDFWIGTKEFSSSKAFGLDTSSDTGNSYQRVGSTGDWTSVSGNLAYHILLDCGENCDDDGCTNGAGDLNEDGAVNILDIVSLANYILGGTLSDCGMESADLNGDGETNILDIVAVVNLILGGRTDDATSAEVFKTDDTFLVTANGYIGGVQMTLVHSLDFSLKLTDDALVAKYHTEGNTTTLIVVVPENDKIFSYVGDFEITELIIANSNTEVTVNTPTAFGLSAAYPNPFNPSTSISLHVPIESDVSVQVYDLSGRMISTLLSGVQAQGDYNLTWNAQDQASGMYLVRAETADQVAVQKVLLLK